MTSLVARANLNTDVGFFQALPTLVLFKDGKPIDKVEVWVSPTEMFCWALPSHV